MGAPTVTLVTTKTCPNCKVAAAMLEKAGIAYTKVLAEERLDLVNKYDIKQAPTMLIEGAGCTEVYVGVPEIKSYIDARRETA